METEEVGLGLTQSLPSRRGWSGPPMTWMHPTVTAMRQRDRTGSDSLARLRACVIHGPGWLQGRVELRLGVLELSDLGFLGITLFLLNNSRRY